MTTLNEDRARRHAADAEAAKKHHGDAAHSDIPENIPADEETEGATNALDAPVAPPEMAKERDEPSE